MASTVCQTKRDYGNDFSIKVDEALGLLNDIGIASGEHTVAATRKVKMRLLTST